MIYFFTYECTMTNGTTLRDNGITETKDINTFEDADKLMADLKLSIRSSMATRLKVPASGIKVLITNLSVIGPS
jgi:hypothetical protein